MVNEFVQQALEEERERTILAQVIPNIDDAEIIDPPAAPRGRFKCPSCISISWCSPRIKKLVALVVILGTIAIVVSSVIVATRDDDTPAPSLAPSLAPTAAPTVTASGAPTTTPVPTLSPTVFFARTALNQRFQIGNQREFNETEQRGFCDNMESYTDDFGGDNTSVSATCEIVSQRLQIIGGSRRLEHRKAPRRNLQGVVFNQVEYAMSFSSSRVNVTWYTSFFQSYVNEDLDRLTTDLQNAGLAVTNSFFAFNNIATDAPAMTPSTGVPVETSAPSPAFTQDPATPVETAIPTLYVSPTAAPDGNGGRKRSPTVVTVSVIAALFFMVAVFFGIRSRRHSSSS